MGAGGHYNGADIGLEYKTWIGVLQIGWFASERLLPGKVGCCLWKLANLGQAALSQFQRSRCIQKTKIKYVVNIYGFVVDHPRQIVWLSEVMQ